jgi:prophage endopeptidase
LRLSIRTTAQPEAITVPPLGLSKREPIDPEDAAALVRITEDGDNAISDLNTCIDGYAQVMRQANGASHEETAIPAQLHCRCHP